MRSNFKVNYKLQVFSFQVSDFFNQCKLISDKYDAARHKFSNPRQGNMAFLTATNKHFIMGSNFVEKVIRY